MISRRTTATLVLLAAAVTLSEFRSARADILEQVEAQVNDELIFAGEIDDAMRFALRGQRLEDISDEEYNRMRWREIKRMVQERLIVQECKRLIRQLRVDEMVIKNEIESIRNELHADYNSRFETAEEREADMQLKGFTSEEDLLSYQMELAETQYYIRRTAPTAIRNRIEEVTEDELERVRADNPAQIRAHERVRVNHILFRCPEGSRPEAEREAREKAEGILLRLKAGESFTELAANYSEHESSRNQGGALGIVQRGRWAETYNDFIDALFEAPLGKTVGPLRSPLGYHVCVVTSKRTLLEELQQQKIEKALLDWAEEIYNRPETRVRVLGALPGGLEIFDSADPSGPDSEDG